MNTELQPFAEAVDAMSARVMAVEALLYALADTCPDRSALRAAFDVYEPGPRPR